MSTSPSPSDAGPRPVHWTEFPESVERFGDLLSILETLDLHDAKEGFTAASFHNESPDSAYTIDPLPVGYRFSPRLNRMPGLERLIDSFDVDDAFTLSDVRDIRRRVASALKIDRAAVGAMTFTEIVEAIDATARGGRPGSPSAKATPPNCGVRTLDDLLIELRIIEQATTAIRAEADAMNEAPGSGHLRIQAGVYEAMAEYKKHPAFPHVEAYVNRHYGPFTYADLLRVRGEICQERGCGTTEADRLTIEEVVDLLRHSGRGSHVNHINC